MQSTALSRSQLVYTPLSRKLKEIRLIAVGSAAAIEDALQCTLTCVSLNALPKPRYETISYVWGNPEDRSSIIINNTVLDVPTSAKRALQRMRCTDRDRTLWIDAVCINQDDVEERGHQVAMMAEVYMGSVCNLIWLGNSDKSTATALVGIQAVADRARRETGNFRYFHNTVFGHTGREDFSSEGLLVDVDFDALLHFYSSPWFERLWGVYILGVKSCLCKCLCSNKIEADNNSPVVQEATLASRSLCYYGQYEISLLDTVRAARWLRYKQLYLPLPLRFCSGLMGAAALWGYADAEHGVYSGKMDYNVGLLRVLMELRWCKASDHRDHVYGLLGLYQKFHIGTELSPLLNPDYNKRLSAVLRDATRFAAEESRTLKFFCRLFHGLEQSSEDKEIPSWVPKWHLRQDPREYRRLVRGIFWPYGGYDIFCPPRMRNSQHADKNVLSVLGTVDCSVKSTIWSLTRPTARTLSLDQFLAVIHKMSGNMFGNSDSIGALALTLVAGVDHHCRPVSAVSTDQAKSGYQALLKYWASNGKQPPPVETLNEGAHQKQDEVHRAAKYWEALLNACINRSLFQTNAGSPGVGPSTVMEGDIVTILWGCEWPVILRPLSQKDEYTVVGTSYVFGIMHGEAIGKFEEESREAQVFHLR